MKSVTLIALIAIILEIIAGLYFALVRFRIIEIDRSISDIMGTFYTMGAVGLLIFFIRLYQKQIN